MREVPPTGTHGEGDTWGRVLGGRRTVVACVKNGICATRERARANLKYTIILISDHRSTAFYRC